MEIGSWFKNYVAKQLFLELTGFLHDFLRGIKKVP